MVVEKGVAPVSDLKVALAGRRMIEAPETQRTHSQEPKVIFLLHGSASARLVVVVDHPEEGGQSVSRTTLLNRLDHARFRSEMPSTGFQLSIAMLNILCCNSAIFVDNQGCIPD